MNGADVKWLQVENTTKCNAWCFSCARNQNGYGLTPGLVIEDLATDRFAEVLDSLPNINTVQFCATYGDFAAAKNVIEHVELVLKRSVKLQIHTHGGIRNADWWADLAKMLSNHKHDVWFALDGLKGIHEIYRQGTDFDKTMANAEAFINAGGHATWQFIPWKHNEHQLKECIKLSQQKGFKKFKLVNAVRDKQTQPFRHWQTGEVVVLEHWSQAAKKNLYLQSSRTIDYTMCMHLNQSSVYLNATGELSPCCFLNLTRASSTLDLIGDIKTELASKPSTTCIHFCGQVKSNDSHS